MTERILLAGFGGQGIITLGKLLARVAMDEGKEVTFFPSYGAEVRGGTANCHVVISDDAIYSPIVEKADTLIVMNQPSYDRFRSRLVEGGLLLVNSSMISPDDALERQSPATLVTAPMTEKANELGNVRVANMAMLGLYGASRDTLSSESLFAGIKTVLAGRKPELLDINLQAFQAGLALAESCTPTPESAG